MIRVLLIYINYIFPAGEPGDLEGLVWSTLAVQCQWFIALKDLVSIVVVDLGCDEVCEYWVKSKECSERRFRR